MVCTGASFRSLMRIFFSEVSFIHFPVPYYIKWIATHQKKYYCMSDEMSLDETRNDLEIITWLFSSPWHFANIHLRNTGIKNLEKSHRTIPRKLLLDNKWLLQKVLDGRKRLQFPTRTGSWKLRRLFFKCGAHSTINSTTVQNLSVNNVFAYYLFRENGICQNWNLSESVICHFMKKLEFVRIGICQNWNLSESEFVRIGICENWNLSESEFAESEFVRIGICQNWSLSEFIFTQNWNLSESEFVRIGICQNRNLSESEFVRIGICQNWYLL